MKITYSLKPNTKVKIANYGSSPAQFNMDGAEIQLRTTPDNLLEKVEISIKGLLIKWEGDDLIDPCYPETRVIAYKIFSYISNRVLAQTSQNAFEIPIASHLFGEVTPETSDEEEIYKNNRKKILSSVTGSYSIIGIANPSDYSEKFTYSQAFSNFADGLKTNNLKWGYALDS